MSAGSLTPNPKDDPMDLGPFMQEYVLRNPFSPQLLAPVPAPTAVPNPVLVAIPKTELRTSPRSSPHFHVSRSPSASPPASKSVVIKTEKSPSPVPPPSVVAENSPASNDASPSTTPVIPEADEGEDYVLKVNTGKVIDTPKAHIGSNASYATQLREMKLPPKHYKVKKWLLQHYKYVSNHSGWISSDNLLREVKTVFEDMKSSVLSRIMKFTYPDCRKVINKYGYFYIGLLARPPREQFDNPKITCAAAEMANPANTKSLAVVAFEHGVEDNMVAAVHAWREEGPLIETGVHQSMSPCVSSDDEDIQDEEPGERSHQDALANEEWPVPKHIKSMLQKQQTSAPQGPPQLKLPKWHLRKRPASGPLGYLKSKLRALARVDNKELKVVADTALNEVPSSRGKGAGRRKKRKVTRHSGPVNLYNGTCKSENNNENSPVNGCDHNKLILGEVYIKPEPLDRGYDKVILQNENANGLAQTNSNNSVVNSGQSHDKLPDSSHANNGRPHDVDSIADMLTLRRTLESTRKELEVKEDQVTQLEIKLQQTEQELTQLKEQLGNRESQFSDLASEFFNLSNNFMKLTHHFKRVMLDSCPPSSISKR